MTDNIKIIDKIVQFTGIKSIFARLFPLTKRAFIESFGKTIISIEGDHKEFKPDPLTIKNLKERAIILSQKTKDSLVGDLRYQLIDAMQHGEGITQITSRLEHVFKMSRQKCEVVARNEILTSQKAGKIEAYEKCGCWGREWVAATNNARTCAICKKLDGQICKNGEWFKHPDTGEDLLYDMAHIQCRCTTIAIMDEPKDNKEDSNDS